MVRFRTAALALATLAPAFTLAACGENATNEPVAATSAALDETPENAPGIALTDAVVQLPAVAGRPGVAYFTISNGSGPARKVASVHVEGAGRTEMHETKNENGVSRMAPVSEVALESGKTVQFAAGGLHVMLFDLDPALKAGGTTELTITLDNGDKASIAATVRSIGGGEEAMAHGSHEM